jgi:endonuclease G
MKHIILFLLVSTSCLGQVINLNHTYYKSQFDVNRLYPKSVEWWLTKQMVTCPVKIGRASSFTPDKDAVKETSINEDYVGSGYDRGHNMPAADNQCDKKGMTESFYFSNMTPQAPALNRGIWKQLEESTRVVVASDDSLHIYVGAFGELKKVKRLSIPEYCWKVIYNKKRKQATAYLFKNDNTSVGNLNKFIIPLEELEKKLGVKFAF